MQEIYCFTNPLLDYVHLKNSSDRYSLIITDLRMPGMTGIDLDNKIRKEKSLTGEFFFDYCF